VQAALNPPAPAEPEAAPEPAPAEQTYTVESGDSLWAIAERFYGDGSQFQRIFDANTDQLSDPNVSHPGQVLRIPA
jgi:nucleoid-associated protein YgaU